MQNNSGKWYMLDKDGKVVEGEDNPEAVSVLAAPGANVPQDVVDKHDLTKRLDGDAPPMVDSAGNPVVILDGRAIAASALPADHPSRLDADKLPSRAAGKPADASRAAEPLFSPKAATVSVDAPKPTAIHSPTAAPTKVQVGTQGSPKGGS